MLLTLLALTFSFKEGFDKLNLTIETSFYIAFFVKKLHVELTIRCGDASFVSMTSLRIVGMLKTLLVIL